MNRQQLKEAVTEAYDQYLDKIEALAGEYGIVPPSVRNVETDTRTAAAAADAWAIFTQAQDDLNNEYATSHEQHDPAAAAAAAHAKALAAAQAAVAAAQTTLDELTQAAIAREKYEVSSSAGDKQRLNAARLALRAAAQRLADIANQ